MLKPAHWLPPKGYSYGVVASGRQVFLAGQIGWDEKQEFTSERLCDQVRQTLRNIAKVLAEAGAGPQHIVRLTWFITDRDEYIRQLAQIGTVYREIIGRHYPPMSVVQVVALMEAKAKVEIEATAVIPDPQ